MYHKIAAIAHTLMQNLGDSECLYTPLFLYLHHKFALLLILLIFSHKLVM
jgi:hypothetical protein